MQNVKELNSVEMQETVGEKSWDSGTYLNKCVIAAYGAAITGGAAAASKGNVLGALGVALGAELGYMGSQNCFNKNGM